LLGSFCVALSIILSTEVGNKISNTILQEDKASLNAAALAEIVRRVMAIPPSLILVWAFSDDLTFNTEGLILSAFTGIIIFNVGSMLMRVALLRATSPTINMLYYIAPVLAVLWLYFLGMGEITPTIIVGGALVIASNVLVIRKSKK
jgi:drug/metabolite transporter (DMT)-like permease